MAEIVHLQDFLTTKTFQQQVISFFQNINFSYQYYKEKQEAVFILKPEAYLVVFIAFVPKNTYTTQPTLEESLYNIQTNPRQSKGEWVVERIFEVPEKHGKELHQLIQKNKEHAFSSLKKVFTK